MRRKLALVAAAIVASGFTTALPAGAECVSAEVWYQEPGKTKQYPAGLGPKKCIRETPYQEGFNYGVTDTGGGVIDVGVWVWVPAP